MAKEIEYELTYLAKRIPDEVHGASGVSMHDIMIPDTVRHPHLRLRSQGDSFVITKKVPLNGTDKTEMSEETIPLEEAEFEALKDCSTKDIVKRRYNVSIDGYSAEVDIFEGKLSGLVVIDFEFVSSSEKNAFIAPEVCLVEISQEESFAGGMLAGKSYADIEPLLDKYGYKKITEETR